MEYSTDNGSTWQKASKDMSINGLFGKTILVRYAAKKDMPVSSETVLSIPTRGSAPVVKGYATSAFGRSDGIIVGTSTAMEYRRVGTNAWIQAPGSTIGYLAAGSYEVRYSATASAFASESCVVTIASGTSGTPGTNPGNPSVPSTPSNPGGGTWYPGNSGHGSNDSGSSSSSKKEYTVSFETNGGSTIRRQIVKKNGTVSVPETPVRDGFIFRGWYSDIKLTNLYDFDAEVTKDITLYAMWEQDSYVDEPIVNNPDPDPEYPPVMDTNPALLDGDMGIAYVYGRSATQFAPNASITRGEVAAILFRLMSENAKTRYYSNVNAFSDVESTAWYNEAISTLVEASVLGGYGDGTFRPDQPVTRAELATIIVRVQGMSTLDGGASFTDTAGHWAEGYIARTSISSLVYRYGDGSFRPNKSVNVKSPGVLHKYAGCERIQ